MDTVDINEDELRARLHIWRAPGFGPRSFQHLLTHFGSALAALAANNAELTKAGLKPAAISSLQDLPADATDLDLAWLQAASYRHIITQDDERYPAALRDLHSAPPLLFVAGDPGLLNDPQIAMVGSRNPTSGGKENAHAFAHYLAQNGLCITSGLALGIDAHSHSGALDAGGSTIAVIGTGLDIIYPARNRALAERIVEHGAIVTEFPIGVKPQAQNFPRRNRIISGMAVGTLVVEAALQSGSLVTARHAMEQGREVFAIPGSIHNPMARGCHQLIRQGAKLVETASDILEEVAPQLHDFLNKTPASAAAKHKSGAQPSSADRRLPALADSELDTELDAEDLQILEALGHDPVPIDQIVIQTGLTTDAVSSMLLMLELQGYVSACGGGHYMRLNPRD